MIAWFAPAMLLLLLAAAQLSEAGSNCGSAVAAVIGEELGGGVARADALELPHAEVVRGSIEVPLPRPRSRACSVRGYGLPAPRAPGC